MHDKIVKEYVHDYDKPRLYIAHALIISSDLKTPDNLVFCGLYKDRRNAYEGIHQVMDMSGVHYIPQVRVAEVLDAD